MLCMTCGQPMVAMAVEDDEENALFYDMYYCEKCHTWRTDYDHPFEMDEYGEIVGAARDGSAEGSAGR